MAFSEGAGKRDNPPVSRSLISSPRPCLFISALDTYLFVKKIIFFPKEIVIDDKNVNINKLFLTYL
jgi:hypothetical protein